MIGVMCETRFTSFLVTLEISNFLAEIEHRMSDTGIKYLWTGLPEEVEVKHLYPRFLH